MFSSGLTERNCYYGIVYALSVREATSFLLGEKGSHIPDMNIGVEVELAIVVTTRSARAGFIVTTIVTSAGWLELHAERNM